MTTIHTLATTPTPRAASSTKWIWLLVAVGLAVLVAAPALLYPIFLMKLLCFGLFAAAFNLLIGYVGLLSFGHAAFFGGAAYIAAYSAKVWGFTPELAILAGTVFAAALGCLIGAIAIRRQGIYFAMITLSCGQLVYFVFVQSPFTGGEDGIQSVPRGALFGLIDLNPAINMYYFVLAIFIAGMFAIWRIVHSPFGAILKSIRENETRAISLGYRIERYKLGAFVLSASIAGLAGGTKAIVFQLATLTDVTWQASGEVILMTLLGGLGTMIGPIVGAGIVLSLENFLAASVIPITVITGSIFVLCVILFRKGIVGEITGFFERRRSVAS